MRTRTRLATLLLPWLAILAHAAPLEFEESAGPSRVSAAGCDILERWTVPYVQGVIGVDASIMRRMQGRFGLDPVAVCMQDWDAIFRLTKLAALPGPEFDQPDKAMEYRLLSYLDDSGTQQAAGLLRALEQKKQIVADTLARRGMMDAGITSASWTALGPFTVGGRMRGLTIHPTNPSRILVGSVSGGIWKSTDGGASFNPINDFASSLAISCLLHDPSNPSTMYACTGEGVFTGDAVRGLGVFKSTDSGETWSQIASTNPANAPSASNPNPSAFYWVNRIAVHPTNSSILLVATADGVFRTTDAGATWTLAYNRPEGCGTRQRVNDVRFDPANGNFAVLGEDTSRFCGASGGAIAWSADAGATWTRVPFAGGNGGRVELAHAPSSVSGGRTMIWYASVDVASGQIWKSTDGGQAWSQASSFGHLGNQGWYDNTIWVAPNDPNRILVGGISLWMSTNGGASLQLVCSIHNDNHVIVTHPDYATTGKVFVGSDGGLGLQHSIHTAVVGAPPGQIFSLSCVAPPEGFIPATNMNNGLAITQFYGGAGSSVPAARLAGGTQDNGSFVYGFGDRTWRRVFGGDGARSAVDPTDSNYSYGLLQNGGLHRNSDGGASQSTPICGNITDVSCSGSFNVETNFITPIALDPNNPNRLYLGAASLWRSDNAKLAPTPSWSAIKPREVNGAGYINFVAVAPSNSDIVWVGHNGGHLYRTMNARAPTPTWTQVLSPGGRQVQKILIDKDDPARVFVTFGGFDGPNVFVSTDGLSVSPTFSPRHGNLPQAPVRAIARHPSSAQWLYAGTEVGVFTSQDGGATWSATNDGPGTVSIEDLFFLGPNTLIASSHGRGMFEATVNSPVTPGGMVQLTASAASVQENGGSIALTVTRIAGSVGPASVQYSTGILGTGTGFATANADFATTSGVLNWAAGDTTSRTITIPIIADLIAEGSETFAITLSNATGAVLGTPATATITIVDPEFFPANCTLPAGWVKSAEAAASWIVATDEKFEGFCSLKSAPIGDSQKAQIQLTTTFAAGNITFRRKVSSEHGYDIFRFYIDGVAQTPDCFRNDESCEGANVTGPTASGDTDWNQPAAILSFPITAGTHTIMFSYDKDGCCIHGSDAAWVDALYLPLPSSAARRYDFNSDTKPDILFRNASSGATYVWRMNGLALANDQFVTSIDPSWSLVGHGDFNGDGRNDLVWRNSASGAAYVWYMNDGVFISDAFVFTIDPTWKIEAVADFNRDGKPDFLFRHSTSGLGFVWYFNNVTPGADQFLYSIDNSWIVENVGDFDGDGYPDFFFRNTSSGLGFVWYWNGSSLGASNFLFSIAPEWQVVQIVDWNNDGKVDLLFRNDNTGVTFVWYTNGVTLQGSDFLFQVDPAWKIVPYR